MLHDDIRDARIQHGLSQAKLARLAKIPRSRLRTFEEGGNITINTLEKIVAQLPNLETVNLGALQIRTGGPDPAEMREALETLIRSAQRMLKLFDSAQPMPEPSSPRKREVRRARRGARIDERES